jgi:photosystem II stability/assembly factor-like uncharacterized protein
MAPDVLESLMTRRSSLATALLLGALAGLGDPVLADRWQPLGPPSGQRITALAATLSGPPAIFAGTFAGVYRSADGGRTWELGRAGLPGSYAVVNGLAVDPARTSTVYAAVGGGAVLAPAGGLFRSDDGGRHWHPLPGRLEGLVLSAVAVDPATSATLWVATSQGLFKSTDRGVTWRSLIEWNRGKFHPKRVLIDPKSPSTVYLLTGESDSRFDEEAIWKTTDGGETWSRMPDYLGSGATQDLALDPNDPDVLYLTKNWDGVFKTTDGGQTWEPINSGLPSDPVDELVCAKAVAVDPRDSAVYVSASACRSAEPVGIFESTDGGATWVPVHEGFPDDRFAEALIAAPPGPQGGPSTLVAATREGIYRSTDRLTWTAANDGVLGWVISQAADPTDPSTVYVVLRDTVESELRSETTWRTRDGGGTWEPIARELGTTFVVAAHPGPPATLYLGSSEGVFTSVDRGDSWVAFGGDPRTHAARVLVPHPTAPGTLYVAEFSGLVVTTDGGTTWTSLLERDLESLAVAPALPGRLYAGVNFVGFPDDPRLAERLFRSDDGGDSWVDVSAGLPAGLEVTAIAPDPVAPEVVLVSLASLVHESPLGTVVRSEDAGQTWTAASRGLPDTQVTDLARSADGSTLFAATYDAGVFQSTDGGDSWLPAGSGLGSPAVESLATGPPPNDLLAGTLGGLFRLEAGPEAGGDPLPPDEVPWLTDPALAGFRVKVRIGQGGGVTIPGAKEPGCIPETVCVSGALPGRSELFVRIIGPRPNGWLWPTLVKFSTSRIEVWIQQLSTGELRYYELRGASPGFDELPGLFDRFGFLPP